MILGTNSFSTSVVAMSRAAVLWLCVLAFSAALVWSGSAAAQQFDVASERLDIDASVQDSFGRIILKFPNRTSMPGYTMEWDNGVLVVAFDVAVRTILPDLSGDLAQFVSAARVDPDGRGIRIGLKRDYKVNKTEAGEQLFIDILPEDWAGVEPGLPGDIVEELSRRAQVAAVETERQRRIDFVRENNPEVSIRLGRHPTFVRLMVDWSIPAKGKLSQEEEGWKVVFDWPVPIDLYALKTDLPEGILDVTNTVDPSGSQLNFELAEGVEPRFYALDGQRYAVDFDLPIEDSGAVDLASLLPEGVELNQEGPADQDLNLAETKEATPAVVEAGPRLDSAAKVTPFVETVGQTVRIVFPFQRDTAAAVFRRGETLWMVFDSEASIGAPGADEVLDSMMNDFTVQATGRTSVVRMGLVSDRLATMGSEGRSWVLSLGDNLLVPAELIKLSRRQTAEGLFEVSADVERPAAVHELRDPEVGDVLSVVTAFPPARGIVRDFDFVDFKALRSVHGLVVQPNHQDLTVNIESKSAIIRAEDGLIVSPARAKRIAQSGDDDTSRTGFVDLNNFVESNPDLLVERRNDLAARVVDASIDNLEQARFDLAKLYLSNQFYYEAAGVLRLMQEDLKASKQYEEIKVAEAAAQTMAGRSRDALEILQDKSIAEAPDALVWRTIAATDAGDFNAARRDALIAEESLDGHPDWVQNKFLLSATEAAVEAQDIAFGNRLIGHIETGGLDRRELFKYQILAARLDEAAGRFDEALDTLGQVVSSDSRPERAEAVYRTLLLLDKMGRLDYVRAAETLASEVLVWRGDDLEASMLKLLAELYFENGEFRPAFETVRTLADARPEAVITAKLLDEARNVFADLYLNGQADGLEPLDALTLYYDFRTFTPAGARGDEMVRNLSRRLVKFDLLEQAAELLQYQVDERLEGAAKSQIAADLAVIYLSQRQPEKALTALNRTRVAGVAPGLERQRRILEARAMIDADRVDLALDILANMDGRDADLLRVDAEWSAKRYQDAAEILELLYVDLYSDGELPQSGRQNIVKAAVGFVLAGDFIGVGRLRERFSQALAQSPEWPLFDFVTGTVQVTSVEFKRIAEEVAGTDSLNAFLKTYQTIYGGSGALAPGVPSGADA